MDIKELIKMLLEEMKNISELSGEFAKTIEIEIIDMGSVNVSKSSSMYLAGMQDSGCEPSCESGCESGCKSGCESGCESGCGSGCVSGCEPSCGSGCESGCDAGCVIGSCLDECNT